MDITITIVNPSAEVIKNLATALTPNKPISLPNTAAVLDNEKPIPLPNTAAEPEATLFSDLPEEPVTQRKKATRLVAKEAGPAEVKPTITLEQVRAKLSALSQAGQQAKVKELLTSFGVKKLTDVLPDDYAELLAKAEAVA